MSQSFVFSPEWNGCRPSATRLVQKTVEGKGTLLPFGVPPPIIWLHFLLPLPMSGDPRSLKCKHLCDPQSFLTVTFWLLDNFSSTWAITWQYTFKMSKIYNRIVHEYKCLFLAFILFQIERERVVTKFGCNGKMSQSYLSYFFDGVPLENFSSFTG